MVKATFTPAYSRLIEFMVHNRKEAGLTQVALAARLKKPQSFVSKLERGERRLDVVEFYAIMRAMNYDPGSAFIDYANSLPDEIEI